jgi:hypothetical protein
MQTLSYGYELPENGDKGSVFFPALAGNIQKQNDHTHNGSNSPRLTGPLAAVIVSQSIASGSWSDQGDGTYRQEVTMTSPYLYDEVAIELRNSSTGERMYLSIVKTAANKFYVYINDNSIALKAVYSA